MYDANILKMLTNYAGQLSFPFSLLPLSSSLPSSLLPSRTPTFSPFLSIFVLGRHLFLSVQDEHQIEVESHLLGNVRGQNFLAHTISPSTPCTCTCVCSPSLYCFLSTAIFQIVTSSFFLSILLSLSRFLPLSQVTPRYRPTCHSASTDPQKGERSIPPLFASSDLHISPSSSAPLTVC